MIWTPRTNAQDIRDWHQHFAIYPVKLADGRKAWLHWVERRLIGYDYFSLEPNWEYRA